MNMNQQIKPLIDYIRYRLDKCTVKQINQILYYSDFKFVQNWYRSMTKSGHHFIDNQPYCTAILASMKPIETYHLNHYDDDSISKAAKTTIDDVITELHMIKQKTGDEGLDNFVKNICNISGRPTINGYEMLVYLSQFWDKQERKDALRYYREMESIDNFTDNIFWFFHSPKIIIHKFNFIPYINNITFYIFNYIHIPAPYTL